MNVCAHHNHVRWRCTKVRTNAYTGVYMYVCVCTGMYVCVYERERETQRERTRTKLWICLYTYRLGAALALSYSLSIMEYPRGSTRVFTRPLSSSNSIFWPALKMLPLLLALVRVSIGCIQFRGRQVRVWIVWWEKGGGPGFLSFFLSFSFFFLSFLTPCYWQPLSLVSC